MNYHRTLCAIALSAAVAAGFNEAHARTPESRLDDPKGRKLDHCFLEQRIATPQLNANGNSTTLRAAEGKVVRRVSMKAGSSCVFTPDGATGTWMHAVNGAPCYVVDGLGTQTATVRRVGNGRGCVGIAQLQFLSATASPSGDNGGNGGNAGNGGDTGGDVGSSLLGSLVVCSNASPAPSDMTFGISISTRYQEIAVLTVPVGGCTEPLQVEEGWYIVSQGMNEGYTVSDISSDPSGRIVSADPLGGSATVLVLTSERTGLTFSNSGQ